MALPAAQEGLKPFLRDLAIGISLANLSYLRIWSETLTYRNSDAFFMAHPPTPVTFLSTILSVVLLGAVLALAAGWARRAGGEWKVWASRAFLISLALPLNALRSVLSVHVPALQWLRSPLFALIGVKGVLVLGIVLAVTGLLAAYFLYRPLTRVAAGVLRALVPFAVVTIGQALWGTMQYNPAPFAAQAAAQPLPVGKPQRVIWMVFDEMDQNLAFDMRDRDVAMPEFDRLRKEGLYAAQAYPPGPETPISMPSYISGRRAKSVAVLGPSTLRLHYMGSEETVDWKDAPNLFRKAREAGFNGSIIGWFHPYCRVMGSAVVNCQWWEMAMQYNSTRETFPGMMIDQARSLVETTLFSPFGQSLSSESHVATYHKILEASLRDAVNRDLGLVLAHFPTPHAPHIYDRKTGQFTRKNSTEQAYWDSLALADRTLGAMRAAMEKAGVWDSSIVLATSDHSNRTPVIDKLDKRVPFLLKPAGSKEGLEFGEAFNTVLAHDLMLAMLNGQVVTVQQAAEWLNQRRGTVAIQ